MFRCCSLYSGSSGNSFFIESDDTKILIDVGVSAKKIVDALKSLQCSITDINAILITHEHIDHTKSLGLLSSKYNIPVYANKKTWTGLNKHVEKMSVDNVKFFVNEKEFKIGNFTIFPFSTSHDALDPCGFNVFYNNKKISLATDIGTVNESLLNSLKNSCFLFLESNYDPNILKYSSYPISLKNRILSNKGHMSNSVAGQVVHKIANPYLKDVLLIHLSKENNFPELVYETISEELSGLNNSPNINIAPRDCPSKFFNI